MTEVRSPRQRALRFGLGSLVVLGAIGVWLWRRKHHPAAGAGVGGVGMLVLLSAVVAPAVTLEIQRLWMKAAGVLGWVNSRILLGVIFVLVFTPIAIIRKLAGGDPLKLRWRPNETGTYWTLRERDADPKHYEHPY